MKIKKLLKLLFICVFISLSFVTNAFCKDISIILNADKAQLEAWGMDLKFIGINDGTYSLEMTDYYGKMSSFNTKTKANLVAEDVLNPTVKFHIMKEFGIEITKEDREMAEKKWSSNPLTEVSGEQLIKWCPPSSCEDLYTETNLNKQEIKLELTIDKVIPKVMFDTGIKIEKNNLLEPKVKENYLNALKDYDVKNNSKKKK